MCLPDATYRFLLIIATVLSCNCSHFSHLNDWPNSTLERFLCASHASCCVAPQSFINDRKSTTLQEHRSDLEPTFSRHDRPGFEDGTVIRLSSSCGQLRSLNEYYPIRYPDGRGSSAQQMVTCRHEPFCDPNTHWILYNRCGSRCARVNGRLVWLIHKSTRRLLNVHNVAAPTNAAHYEVSGFVNFSLVGGATPKPQFTWLMVHHSNDTISLRARVHRQTVVLSHSAFAHFAAHHTAIGIDNDALTSAADMSTWQLEIVSGCKEQPNISAEKLQAQPMLMNDTVKPDAIATADIVDALDDMMPIADTDNVVLYHDGGFDVDDNHIVMTRRRLRTNVVEQQQFDMTFELSDWYRDITVAAVGITLISWKQTVHWTYFILLTVLRVLLVSEVQNELWNRFTYLYRNVTRSGM